MHEREVLPMPYLTPPLPIFKEEQRFRHPFIWVPIFPLFVVAVVALVLMLLASSGVEFLGSGYLRGNDALVPLSLITAALGATMVLIYVCNLTTEVREDGLYVRYFPFHLKFRRIAIEDVKKIEVKTYRPIRDYGGWGIKYGFSNGWVYNVSGNRGVKLHFVKGSPLLIGSQRPEALATAINKLLERR